MYFRYGKREIYHAEELIVVGDIHGEDKKLENILEQVIPFLDNSPRCHIVFCGDICNRGPNSAKVFEVLIELKKNYSEQAFFIMGNHEEMLITTLDGETWWSEYTYGSWNSMVAHWNVPIFSAQDLAKECLKRGVVDFLDNLLPYYENDEFICTHAPLDRVTCGMNKIKDYEDNFGKELNQKYFLERMTHDLRWSFTDEDPKLSCIPEIKKYHICGHQFKHHKQPRLFRHRAFIDVGCGTVKEKPLVAVKFPGKKIYRSFSKPIQSV